MGWAWVTATGIVVMGLLWLVPATRRIAGFDPALRAAEMIGQRIREAATQKNEATDQPLPA